MSVGSCMPQCPWGTEDNGSRLSPPTLLEAGSPCFYLSAAHSKLRATGGILLSDLPACCHIMAGTVDEHPQIQVSPCIPWLNLGYQVCAAGVFTIWAPPCSDLFLPTPLLFFGHCTRPRWLSVCRVWKSLRYSHPTSSFHGSSFRPNIISRARTPCSCESDSVSEEEEKWVIKISYKIIQRIIIIVTF